MEPPAGIVFPDPDRASMVEADNIQDETLVGAIVPTPLARAWRALLLKQGKTLTRGLFDKIASDFEKAGEPPPPELASALAQFGPKGRRRRTRRVP